MFKICSLFAGVGGIDLGFLKASDKFIIEVANEIDNNAIKTYKNNFNHNLVEGDIEQILTSGEYCKLVKDVDILTAGFPCQPFSVAGYQKGFEDNRGNMFFYILKYIELSNKKPKVLMLENVKNLLTHDDGKTFETMVRMLNDVGYHVKYKVMNTSDYTYIPQNRERLFIVCFLDKENYDKFDFLNIPILSDDENWKIKKNEKIHDIIKEDECYTEFYYTKEKYPKLFDNELDISQEISKEDTFYQIRRRYVRENKSGVCPTLTANMGTGGHNVPMIKTKYGIRKLTPEECFKLQGFPIGNGYMLPDIAKSHLYKQAGNSVTVPVITLIAKEILKVIDNEL